MSEALHFPQLHLGGQPGFWAYAESPLVDGDVVVVTPGGSPEREAVEQFPEDRS